MSLSLVQTLTAVGINMTVSFGVSGGTAPYTYSVRPNGAGGTINSSGIYTAPANYPTTAKTQIDTIFVQDSSGLTITGTVLVGDPLLLFCDVLQNQLGLAQGRVYIWDQKIMQPTDNGLYIAVAELSCKPFANTNRHDGTGSGLNAGQSVNMYSLLQIDAISRDSSARLRKEEILMALKSDYAQAQQEANGFFIGQLPAGSQFLNLSAQDGAAIPYRYNISIAIQYFRTKTVPVNYISTFSPVQVTTQS